MSNFNFMNVFKYLGEAMQIGSLVEALPFHAQVADYFNLTAKAALIVAPPLAGDKNFQAAQGVLSALAAAENGQTGVVGTVPLDSHGTPLKLTLTVGPA